MFVYKPILRREDVLGNSPRIFGVECVICGSKRLPLTICDKGCNKYYCDRCLEKHESCEEGSFKDNLFKSNQKL